MIISYHIISYHIISYHIISYHIISHHIISYHIISYHASSTPREVVLKLYKSSSCQWQWFAFLAVPIYIMWHPFRRLELSFVLIVWMVSCNLIRSAIGDLLASWHRIAVVCKVLSVSILHVPITGQPCTLFVYLYCTVTIDVGCWKLLQRHRKGMAKASQGQLFYQEQVPCSCL